MQQALVTGADGFIGSHLSEALVRKGVKVKALACYNSFGSFGWLDGLDPEILNGMQVTLGDIRDERCVRTAMEGCDTVFHLAALIAIPFSYQAPRLYVDTNVHGTLNVLEAARALGISRMLHTSTSEVYGTAQRVPIDENHPLQAQSPYAASKVGADQLALSYWRSFGLPVTVIRPFNTYGPRQSNRAVIPAIIAQIAAGVSRLQLGQLDSTRDFNYVGDTVSGFLAGALAPKEVEGEVFNLGTGFEISIGDLAREIAGLMGKPMEIEVQEERLRPEKSEVMRLLADASKARKQLHWHPALEGRDGLRQGLRQTIQWFLDPKNLAAYKATRYVV